ncbi:class I SAM-dependent methyltransferase [Methylobacterium oryzisoli]|uniref:class I SAM-dependent methyltransferase n=1 Tax=Methylobacterium oryzisoli TaxID=3385502 RepID=UPI00389224F5
MSGVIPLQPPPAPESVFVAPRTVTDLAACHFTHAVDLPGHGSVAAPWDLRATWRAYIGEVDVAGKRVLDVGTGSGFLSFAMERAGARVTSLPLDRGACWDIVPFPGVVRSLVDPSLEDHHRRIADAYWFSHAALGSRARVVQGSPYAIPRAVAPLDVAVFATALMRLRDPFRALHAAAQLTRESLVVTEFLPRRFHLLRYLPGRLARGMYLVPRADARARFGTWWVVAPETVREFLRILGFGETRVSLHRQRAADGWHRFYTVVGRRTEPTNPDL